MKDPSNGFGVDWIKDHDLMCGLDFVAPIGAFDEYNIGEDLVGSAAQRFM